MARAAEHANFNLVVVTATSVAVQLRAGEPLDFKPFLLGGVTYFLPSLPDLLEPPTHPRHRKVFHSVAMAAVVGYGTYRLYKWKPENEWQELLRLVSLVAGTAYLAHLARDALTPKSLPLI